MGVLSKISVVILVSVLIPGYAIVTVEWLSIAVGPLVVCMRSWDVGVLPILNKVSVVIQVSVLVGWLVMIGCMGSRDAIMVFALTQVSVVTQDSVLVLVSVTLNIWYVTVVVTMGGNGPHTMQSEFVTVEVTVEVVVDVMVEATVEVAVEVAVEVVGGGVGRGTGMTAVIDVVVIARPGVLRLRGFRSRVLEYTVKLLSKSLHM